MPHAPTHVPSPTPSVPPPPLAAWRGARVDHADPATPGAAIDASRLVGKPAQPGALAGWINGLLGMLIFSGSLPATRVALDGFTPSFLTFTRASLAGLLALAVLLATRSRRPTPAQWLSLAAVALGAVVGFPLFTGIALQSITSAQALVFIGLLPLCTALFGVMRTAERPSPWFWIFAVLGAAIIVAYALYQIATATTASTATSAAAKPGGHAGLLLGEAMMLLAVIVCGYAYAEGARLARGLGGWQVICWALVLSLPAMLLAGWIDRPWGVGHAAADLSAWLASVSTPAWIGLGYVSLFSMLIGFFFWYRGLALGGIAAVGQLQLLQPFVGLVLAALVLHETIRPSMLGVSAAVVACVAFARRATTRKPG